MSLSGLLDYTGILGRVHERAQFGDSGAASMAPLSPMRSTPRGYAMATKDPRLLISRVLSFLVVAMSAVFTSALAAGAEPRAIVPTVYRDAPRTRTEALTRGVNGFGLPEVVTGSADGW